MQVQQILSEIVSSQEQMLVACGTFHRLMSCMNPVVVGSHQDVHPGIPILQSFKFRHALQARAT